jgi:hypothetical protein
MMPCVTRDQTVIVNNRHKLLNGLTPQKPKHSFTIDALVGSDSCKDGPISRPSSTPSPSSGKKSLSPPQMISSAKAFAPIHHQLPHNDLLRFMNNYPSSPHVSAPHFVPSHTSHPLTHTHHHQPPPHPHPMALSMINSMPRTNHIAPDFYNNNVNINPGFGHWSPYMRHSQLMPPIHGMSVCL